LLLDDCGSTRDKSNIFVKISEHFEKRLERAHDGKKGSLTRELNRGRNVMTKWVTEEKKVYAPGAFGNPDLILSYFLQDAPAAYNAFYSFIAKVYTCNRRLGVGLTVVIQKTWVCGQGHTCLESYCKPCHVLVRISLILLLIVYLL
jgi:hypothetical protein